MITHPHLLGAAAAGRQRDLLAEAAQARLVTEVAAAEPARRRLRLGRLALLAGLLLALLAGLLLGDSEAAAMPRGYR